MWGFLQMGYDLRLMIVRLFPKGKMFNILRDTSCCHDCYKWLCLLVEVNVICDTTRKEITEGHTVHIIVTLICFILLPTKGGAIFKTVHLKKVIICIIIFVATSLAE